MSAPHLSPAPKRSGSEKRQRGKGAVLVRLLPTERAMLEDKAQAAKQSLAGYLRECGLGSAGPRAKRRPSIDAVALAQAVAQLNRVGSNLSKIVDRQETTEATATAQETDAALAETRTAVARILEIVGRKARA